MIALGLLKYVSGGGFSRTVTIDRTKAGSSNLSNFPVLVSISDTTLKTVANGGHVTRSDGNDILFYSDSGLTTLLNWEIDTYAPTTGVLNVWVSIPTLNGSGAGSNTVFYMKYGDSITTTFQGGSAGAVWTNDGTYKGVWHMGDGSTLGLSDSTTNGVTLTNHGSATATTGQIGGGVNLNGSTQWLSGSDAGFPSGTANKTASGWVQWNTNSTNYAALVFYGTYSSTNMFEYGITPTPDFFISQHGSGVSDLTTAVSGTWYYLVATVSGSNYILYRDGNNVASGTMTTNTVLNQLNIGAENLGAGAWVKGIIDEVRISTAVRSADWVKTEYNNQKNPGNIGSANFLSYSAETTL